jgi:hypothetical protein
VYLAPLGQERVEWQLDGRERLVPANTSALLGRCVGFRSLDEHARRIAANAGLGAARVAPLRRRLESLAEAGLMTSYDDLLRRCQAQPLAEPPPAPIGMLGVPSCDRPETLARGLRSYMQNSRDYGREVEFVVVDDSRDAANRARNRENLRALAREFGTRTAYAGREEREAYVQALVRHSGVPQEVVRFGLAADEPGLISTGAARNTLLLHASGRRFIHVDDDTLCRVAASPGAAPGMALVGVHTGMEHSFFADLDEARAAVHFEPRDYVGLYEEALGRSVSELLIRAGSAGPIDLDELPTAFAQRLQQSPSRIVLASLGVVGDSGFGAADMYFFTANATSRERLLSYPGGYREAFRTQQVIRATRRATLAEAGLCLGIALGIDASVALPPFLSVLRNSDGVFDHARHACCRNTAVAYLPWVVTHAPPRVRGSSFEATLAGAGRVSFPEFIAWFIRDWDARRGDGDPCHTRALGQHLAELAAASPADYIALSRQKLRDRVAGMRAYVDYFEGLMDDTASDFRRDLRTYVDTVAQSIDLDEAVVPTDLREVVGAADAIAHAQRLLGRFAELLLAWPDLWRASRRIKLHSVDSD